MHHPGELSVQHRAGVYADAHGSATVGSGVPAVAQQFLLEQRMIVISAEHHDSMWTTVLVGQPGFIETLDETTFNIKADLPAEDPLFGAFDAPLDIGMIAIEPETRRRMRINGRGHMHENGLLVHADQLLGNCPKYISTRRGELVDLPPVTGGRSRLTEEQLAWVESADTFFVGTGAPGLGADASHRGGNPGFVSGEPERLSWPDYLGNSMYMTFGNLELDPRAGLLFIDFENGHSLHIERNVVMNLRSLTVAIPLLMLVYGVARWFDGRDGEYGPGVAWNIGHAAFLAAFVGFGALTVHFRRSSSHPHVGAIIANVASLVGVGLFIWVITTDLIPALDERASLPDPVMAVGPLISSWTSSHRSRSMHGRSA